MGGIQCRLYLQQHFTIHKYRVNIKTEKSFYIKNYKRFYIKLTKLTKSVKLIIYINFAKVTNKLTKFTQDTKVMNVI